jgi:hypothetical protein
MEDLWWSCLEWRFEATPPKKNLSLREAAS